MAESILYDSVQQILVQLASLAVKEFSLAWGLEGDLERLRKTLTSISAVLSDAEEQRFTNHKISLWLGRLRDVLYDAEDVLGDFAYEALRREVISSQGNMNRKVGRFFSSSNPIAYRLRIGHKIKEIRKRLDEIKADKDEFNLNERVDHGRLQLKERELTNSLVSASEVIGRDEDREKIVELLIGSDGLGDNHDASVIPIVGIGGMGKTALAKLVYNDQRVAGHFDSKVWVCLGDMKKFDVNHVIATITGQTRPRSEELENFIRDKFGSKKFLLVLDDLWDADRSKWLDFKGMLSSSTRGSKILVSTRDSSMAQCVGTVPMYKLEGLAHEQCVSLFKKVVFGSEVAVDQSLMKIGDEIVRKCKGVPLAVRTLGSHLSRHLSSESRKREWESVRDSDIWKNDIIDILKFSYDRMPFHLKLCFLHCSIFPEDAEFHSMDLISLWMAHGLLKGDDPHRDGERYINELMSRGFFQDFEQDTTFWSRFKMHDLVWELARSMAKDEFQIRDGKYENVPKNGRHVWLDSGKQESSANFNGHDHVRSVITHQSSSELLKAVSSECNNLRLLWVRWSYIPELPKCVGSLKYLRYLNLVDCKNLKNLPESICKLHNLETLSLLGCEQLEEIPKNIGELVNLRCLTVTTKQKHFPKNGIESLASLQFLFLASCEKLETLFEDSQIQLKSLRILVIYGCDNLKPVCLLPGSTGKQHSLPALESLYLGSCNIGALEFLRMAPKLVSLDIVSLPVLDTLSGLSPECAGTLRYLKIYWCPKLRALPEWLSNLTSLETLRLEDCRQLSSLPQGIKSLTALHNMTIVDCGDLSERCRKGQGEEWFKIAHVPNVQIDPR